MGKPRGRPRKEVFLLEYTKDKHAVKALYTYALSVAKENPTLADELMTKVAKYREITIEKGAPRTTRWAFPPME